MDRDECLRVLSLLADARPVEPELAVRAQAFAAADPGLRSALADFRRLGLALAAGPARRASPGFTERVLAAAREQRRGAVLVLTRRLAAAAALVLALGLGWDLARPDRLVADDEQDRAWHAMDALRPEAFGPTDIEQGLPVLWWRLLADPAKEDR